MEKIEPVKLEPIEKDDLYKIVQWNADKSSDFLLQWAGPNLHYPLTFKQLENYFITNIACRSTAYMAYRIVSAATDVMVGYVELREVDNIHKTGRVCRFLIGDENSRGKGYGLYTLKRLLEVGFKDLDYNKITLGVFEFNLSALKCYEKAGFTKEKLIEKACESENGYWNVFELSITKEKWLSLEKR